MATKITRSDECRSVIMNFMQVIEPLNEAGVRPEDIVHALTFILVVHKEKNAWSTEQMLQMFEYYVSEIEDKYPFSPSPIGEA